MYRIIFVAMLAMTVSVPALAMDNDQETRMEQAKKEMRAMEDKNMQERRAMEDECHAKMKAMHDVIRRNAKASRPNTGLARKAKMTGATRAKGAATDSYMGVSQPADAHPAFTDSCKPIPNKMLPRVMAPA